MCDVRRCRREPEVGYVVDGCVTHHLCGPCWEKAAGDGVDTAAWVRARVAAAVGGESQGTHREPRTNDNPAQNK